MEDKKFAVLIDADNNNVGYIKTVMDEITNEGIVTYKRIYGDWTSPSMKPLKEILLEYSITPIQQYAYTTGKNATDSAMIIDAMDILYTGNVDGFCLVSSDSDFTKLASRLREAGMKVVGMGKKQTPKAFVAACNKFIFVDIIGQNTKSDEAKEEPEAPAVPKKKSAASVKAKPPKDEDSQTPMKEIRKAIWKMIEEHSDDDGWMLVSLIGNMLQKKYSDFDTRNYGYKKMVDLLKGLNLEIRNFQDPNNKKNPTGYVVYARIKNAH